MHTAQRLGARSDLEAKRILPKENHIFSPIPERDHDGTISVIWPMDSPAKIPPDTTSLDCYCMLLWFFKF